MDPPLSRLERIEGVLQQHEAMMTAAVTETKQAAAAHEQALTMLAGQLQQLTALLTQAPQASGAASPPAPPATAPALAPAPLPPVDAPEPQPRTFATEGAKVAFVINHLTGRARLWGTAEWERRSPACASFDLFATELRKVFGLDTCGPEAIGGLIGLKQGERTVADYSIDFRTRASRSKWNYLALCDAFLNGLADYIKDELVSHDLPTTLDGVVELATRIDLRIQARIQQQRPDSARPEPSCLSFKSDQSKEDFLDFKEGRPSADQMCFSAMDQCEYREEGVAPSESSLCGEHDSQTKAQKIQQQRPDSAGPEPSCLSFKSNQSKEDFLDFKEGRPSADQM
eukprot:superscaffoldBa00003762_g17628